MIVSVYILRSLKDNGYYIGITANVNRRLQKHNSGGVKSTRNRKPWELIYKEEFVSYEDARIREIEIKSYKGGNSFKKLISKT